jgi:hypothetical protein
VIRLTLLPHSEDLMGIMARDVLAGDADAAVNSPGKQANLSGLLLPQMEVLWRYVALCCCVSLTRKS